VPETKRVASFRTGAAVAIVVVALIAGLVALRLVSDSNPPAPTPAVALSTPSPTSPPSIAATASPANPTTIPTASPSARPPATPSRPPTPNPLAGTPWKRIGYYPMAVDWSPTGEWLLLRTGDQVELHRGSDMFAVRSYDAPNVEYAQSDWIDEDSFLLYSANLSPTDELTGLAWLGTVTTEGLTGPVDVPMAEESGYFIDGLGNGHGAIAFSNTGERDDSCGARVCPTFRIWTVDSTSATLRGQPIAWSPLGDRLAVIHPRFAATNTPLGIGAGVAGLRGWLEVLAWPSLETIYKDVRLETDAAELAFASSGRYLIVQPYDREILDVEEDRLRSLHGYGDCAWDAIERLICANGADVVAIDPDLQLLERWPDAAGVSIDAAPNGQLVVIAHYSDGGSRPGSVTLLSANALTTIDVPEAYAGWQLYPLPGPDGQSLAMYVLGPGQVNPILFYRLPTRAPY
jgi:hypothetical protein